MSRPYSNIVDGNYKFQVTAVAASGDVGAAQEADFTVDTTGPTVDNVTFSALCVPALKHACAPVTCCLGWDRSSRMIQVDGSRQDLKVSIVELSLLAPADIQGDHAGCMWQVLMAALHGHRRTGVVRRWLSLNG